MRRILSSIVIVGSTLVASLAFAQRTVTVGSGCGCGPLGSTVTIPIFIDDASGVLGLDLTMQYAAAVLRPRTPAVRVVGVASAAGCSVVSNGSTEGEVRISLFCTTPLSGSGAVLEFDFTVIGSGACTLPVRSCELNEGQIPCRPVVGRNGPCVTPTPTPTVTVTATATTAVASATKTVTPTPSVTPTRTATTGATATMAPTPLATTTPEPLGASAKACRTAILGASGAFVRAKTKALQKCEQAIVKDALPAGTDCEHEASAAAVITKAMGKVFATIAKKCGGKDKLCGGPDDSRLSDIGWNPSGCPTLLGAGCAHGIDDCDDIASCLVCLGDTAVGSAISLYYAGLTDTDARSKDKTTKALNKCQVTIGKETAAFLSAKSKALEKCWVAVSTNKAPAPCPDRRAQGAIDKAKAKQVSKICAACGGGDKACGGSDDVTPDQIGFPTVCPELDPPGAEPACGGAISDLQDLVDCVRCVTDFMVDCPDRAAAPSLVSYPLECGPPS